MKMQRKAASLLLTLCLILLTAGGVSAAEGTAGQDNAGGFAAPVKDAARNIKIDIHHLLLEADGDNLLQVKEVLKVNNAGNTVFIGETKPDGIRKVLEISLPPGFFNLQVNGLEPNAIVSRSDGIFITTPLNPGITEISLTYELSMTEGSVNFPKVINNPTEMFYVLSPQGQLKIRNDGQIQDYGIQSLNGQQYHVLSAASAVPSQKFTLTISPDRLSSGYQESKSGFHSYGHLQRWANSPLRNTNPHIWVGAIMLLFFAAAVAGSYYIRQKHLRTKQQEQEEKMANLLDDLYIRQKRLLDKIDALDQKNEQNQLESEEYTFLRNQYIAKLTKIKLKIREQELLEE